MVFLYLLYKSLGGNKYEEYTNNYIPKIIHQTAPQNKEMWPKTWEICQQTWKKHFPSPEYKYILWNDAELNKFIKTHYKWFYDYYIEYKHNICRIDAARYFIL